MRRSQVRARLPTTRCGADSRCATGRKRLKSVDEVLIPVRALARELSVAAPQR